ncbi:MAG TPA: hypothetical protein VNO17_12125 [Actinomycetota bacterium]|nr:hypothetical protein [Actinomycetota bacterium]
MEGLIARRVRDTKGRISAERLLPEARAAGYAGSARNLRRAVARAKAEYRRKRRTYRPWVPSPGQHLVIDWGEEGGLPMFCAVLAWSRYRFVRFAPGGGKPPCASWPSASRSSAGSRRWSGPTGWPA